jgi:CubicO group peptidase (beta-lactamase class C family)
MARLSALVWVLALAGACLSGGVAAAPNRSLSAGNPDEDSPAEVADYLAEVRATMGWPGLAAALVSDHEVVWAAGFGQAGPDGRPVTADTPFLLASLSKAITAVAVMRLVEAGQIDLADPLSAYLPELGPGGDGVSVREVMVHRTGLSRRTGVESFAGASAVSLEANVGRLGRDLEPGSGFAYSNANYEILALLVQRASGLAFEDYLQQQVFAPLGMEQATSDPKVAAREGVATGYYHWLGAGYRPFDPPLPDGMAGGYRMFASASDMARLLVMHLNDGRVGERQVLSAASVAVLQGGEPLSPETPVTYGGGVYAHPPGMPWMRGGIADYATLNHDGSALSFRTYMWAMPEAGRALVLMVNANDWADESLLPFVAHNVQNLLYGIDPSPVSRGSDPLTYWAKPMIAALALAEVLLAAVSLWPLRRVLRGRAPGRFGTAVLVAASIFDLMSLTCLVWAIPRLTDAPLRVVALAPDARILLTCMGLGLAVGALRALLLSLAWRTRHANTAPQAA